MAEATLSLTLADLRQRVCDYHGWGTTSAPSSYYSGSTTTQKALVDEEITRGLRVFYNPVPLPGETLSHQWTFLRPTASIVTFPALSQALSAISTTTLTMTAGLFLAAHVGQIVTFGATSNTYKVVTFTDTNNVIVDASAAGESGTDTITIDNDDLLMPDLFGSLVGDITYAPTEGIPPIQITGEGNIRALRQASDNTGRPTKAAIRPKSFTAATGQRWELMLWPKPDAAYTLGYTYHVLQNNIITTATDYYPGGAQHGETIIQAVLSISEQRKEGFRTYHRELFASAMAASIAFDRQSGWQNLGYNDDHSDNRLSDRRSELKNVTFNNVTY